jgi:hypothetical protein
MKSKNSKILICGDSFAADWSVKYPGHGWPTMLAQDYRVTNVAQAGCSEYKIHCQLHDKKITDYAAVIIWHTGPYRIPVTQHPVHHGDRLHHHSDLLYSDIKAQAEQRSDLDCIVEFYEKYFDTAAAEFTHNLICEHIEIRTHNHPCVIHAHAMPWDGLYKFRSVIDFQSTFDQHRGLINHFTDNGNQIVYNKIKDRLYEQAAI